MVFLEIKMIFFCLFVTAVAALVKNNQFKSISLTHLSWVQLTKIPTFVTEVEKSHQVIWLILSLGSLCLHFLVLCPLK